jgi:Flp pilus assembly protein TadG
MMWKSRVRHSFMKMVQCQAGNFALIFAVLSPVILGLTGAVLDLAAFERQRSEIQDAADTVALAAAKEAAVRDWSLSAIQSIAEAYVDANLAHPNNVDTSVFTVLATPDVDKREVSVSISMDHYSYFLLGYFTGTPQIAVTSVAKLSGQTPTCLLSLDGNTPQSILVTGKATIVAKRCAAYSNSIDTEGLTVDSPAIIDTAFTCTSGGYVGSMSSFNPMPTKDCPQIPDPLSARIAPTVGPCDFTGLELKNVTKTISPGVYCGGILIDNLAKITLSPGIYIINGGALLTRNSGSLTGKGVTLYFTGIDGRLLLDGTSTVSLEAPETGSTAGLLMFQDPVMALTQFEISSKKASTLLGTIYLPNGKLLINAKNKVAEASAFTVIVSRFLEVGGKTEMYLNSDYASTSVPVPDGLGPNQTPRLLN